MLLLREFFFLTSRKERKKEKTLNTRVEKQKTCFTHCVEIPAQRQNRKHTHNMGVSILHISNSLLYSHTNDILLDEFEGFDAMVPSRDDFVARFHVDFFFRAR